MTPSPGPTGGPDTAPAPRARRPQRAPTHHDDHVPELLEQAHLPVACFELPIVGHRDLKQAAGLAQRLHDLLHGVDALLLLGSEESEGCQQVPPSGSYAPPALLLPPLCQAL